MARHDQPTAGGRRDLERRRQPTRHGLPGHSGRALPGCGPLIRRGLTGGILHDQLTLSLDAGTTMTWTLSGVGLQSARERRSDTGQTAASWSGSRPLVEKLPPRPPGHRHSAQGTAHLWYSACTCHWGAARAIAERDFGARRLDQMLLKGLPGPHRRSLLPPQNGLRQAEAGQSGGRQSNRLSTTTVGAWRGG